MSQSYINELSQLESDFYKIVPHEGAKQIALIFSSVNMEPRKYVFFRNTIDLPVHKIYLNERINGWYQTGIEGLGNSIDETVQTILKWKEKLGAEEIVTIGSSMGAYGAILYAAKLKGRALCFGAEVVLGLPGSRVNIYMPKDAPIIHNDIRPLILESNVQVTLYAGEADTNDLIAAKYLYNMPNVECITIRGVGHKTPYFLEKKFGVKEVIYKFILGDPISEFKERGIICESGNAVELLVEANNKIMRKQWQEAKKLLIEVLTLCPTADIAHHKLGIVLYQLKDFNAAAEHQAIAVEISPHFANAQHQLGICLRKLGKAMESYEAHKRAFKEAPDLATAYHHAGLSLEILKRYNEAEDLFREAVNIDKNNANYKRKLAVFLKENGIRRIEESQKLLLSL